MTNGELPTTSQNKAYTLIEILVVLTIIGILFTVGYAGYRDFGRRQALAGAAKIVQGDLRKAQQNALSGQKPSHIFCNNPRTLDGYFFRVNSETSYEIGASCSGGDVVTETITVPGNISISSPTVNPILFKILGTGTNISSGDAQIILTQDVTGNTLTINIGPGGDIR